jgi:hypothetical protein
MNSQKHFFNRNILVTTALSQYAPSDSKLLNISPTSNIADPFFKFFMQVDCQDSTKNNFLVGMNLLSFLQYVNQILSKLYAAAQFMVHNRETSTSPSSSQLEIDFDLHKRSCILHEYQYSFREFVLMLKIIVDQFIILMPSNLKKTNSDCIGGLLREIRESQTVFWNDDIGFLVGLNAAANYLKHHPYQFEEPSMMLHLKPPSLLVIVSNDDKERDCLDLKNSFTNQIQYFNDDQYISCLISCDFLVNGFNQFHKKFTQIETV